MFVCFSRSFSAPVGGSELPQEGEAFMLVCFSRSFSVPVGGEAFLWLGCGGGASLLLRRRRFFRWLWWVPIFQHGGGLFF